MSAEGRSTVDDDDSVSMLDVLAQESRMQEDASAVLGASDDQECTYAKGYVNRQALYACATCATTEPAGVCLACSYHCHEGHDLFELYTKRNFRCDCGNSKFKDITCKLEPTKSEVNEENQYNQNFKGAYCICSRPYPDPEDEIEDVMIQCVVCEDWYHGRHLGTDTPENDRYQEMICTGCMAKHPFLWAYQVSSSAEIVQRESGGEEKVDVEGRESKKTRSDVAEPTNLQPSVKSEDQAPVKEESDVSSNREVLEKSVPEKGLKRNLDPSSSSSEDSAGRLASSTVSSDSGSPAKKPKAEEEGGRSESAPCLLQDLRRREVTVKDCATFWMEGWREKLCSCDACLCLYKREGLSFLLDLGDTVSAYEEKGRSSAQPASDLEQEHSVLSGMNRFQQIEMINGFNDLKSELSGYLKTFAETGKVVSSDDIKEFFARMEKRKKERLAGVQHFCK